VSAYRVDGLRLDAVDAIVDEGAPHVVTELADRVRAARPDALLIAETTLGDRRPIELWGADAEWDDGFHHALHVLVTGERDGYYEP
jgi:1,4-alpha-glucan branching enzyme